MLSSSDEKKCTNDIASCGALSITETNKTSLLTALHTNFNVASVRSVE